MGKLVLHLPDGTVQDVLLGKERITIGRRSDNDVCLPYPAVSSEHAAVVTILNDSFLEDLGSTNGTLVNGTRILKHLLRDHDQIDIGRQRLVYFINEGVEAEPLPPDVRLRDLEGLRDQVERARSRRSDARRMRAPEPEQDDEILADLEQSAAPAGAERALPASAVEMAVRGPGSVKRAPAGRRAVDGAANRSAVETDAAVDFTHPLGTPAAASTGLAADRARMPVSPVAEPVMPSVQLGDRRLPSGSSLMHELAPAVPSATISTTPPAVRALARRGVAAPRVVMDAPAPARPPATLWVRVLTGPNAGRELPVAGTQFVLGQVGQQVARLVQRDGVWMLVPVEGDAPLLLNGARVSGEGAFVAPGDRFTVAGAELEVERR